MFWDLPNFSEGPGALVFGENGVLSQALTAGVLVPPGITVHTPFQADRARQYACVPVGVPMARWFCLFGGEGDGCVNIMALQVTVTQRLGEVTPPPHPCRLQFPTQTHLAASACVCNCYWKCLHGTVAVGLLGRKVSACHFAVYHHIFLQRVA